MTPSPRPPAGTRPPAGVVAARARGVALLLLVCLVWPVAQARALPFNVRARAAVELAHTRTRDGLVLEGRLVDDEGSPISGAEVALEVGRRPLESLTTSHEGTFSLVLDRRATAALERAFGTSVPWSARFPGSRRYSEGRSEGTLDLTREAARLTLELTGATRPPGAAGDTDHGGVIAILPPEQPVTLFARLESPTSRRGLADAEVKIRVGEARELVGRTGPTGQVAFILTPEQLEPGLHYRIVARFAGDLLRVPALAELDLTVLLTTRLTLRVVREGDARRGRYRFSGRLSDQDGPLAEALVVIEGAAVDGSGAAVEGAPGLQRLVATGPDGLFVTSVSAKELDEQKLRRLLLQATFQPTDGRHVATRSRPVLLEVPPPPGIPAAWYLVALGTLALVAGLTHAQRSGALRRGWRALCAWLEELGRRLRGARPGERSPAPVSSEPGMPLAARPRARVDHVSGRVLDQHDGGPVAATVRALGVHHELEATTDAEGYFDLGPLEAGPWRVEIAARTHVSRSVGLEVPHSGHLDGARFTLVAVKRKLRDIMQESVGALGGELAWGVDTPREALARTLTRLPDRGAERSLAELTVLVEHAHFAREPVEVSSVDHARGLQRQLAAYSVNGHERHLSEEDS